MNKSTKKFVILAICAAVGAISGVAGNVLGLSNLVTGGAMAVICAVMALALWRRLSSR